LSNFLLIRSFQCAASRASAFQWHLRMMSPANCWSTRIPAFSHGNTNRRRQTGTQFVTDPLGSSNLCFLPPGSSAPFHVQNPRIRKARNDQHGKNVKRPTKRYSSSALLNIPHLPKHSRVTCRSRRFANANGLSPIPLAVKRVGHCTHDFFLRCWSQRVDSTREQGIRLIITETIETIDMGCLKNAGQR
jgi:hypothetical protein